MIPAAMHPNRVVWVTMDVQTILAEITGHKP
jgi:hypothetical protein